MKFHTVIILNNQIALMMSVDEMIQMLNSKRPINDGRRRVQRGGLFARCTEEKYFPGTTTLVLDQTPKALSRTMSSTWAAKSSVNVHSMLIGS